MHLFMKEKLNLPYLKRQEYQKNWQHSDELNDKLPNIDTLSCIIIMSGVCGYLKEPFLCQFVTQTETRSSFTPMIGFNYLTKLATEIRFCWWKSKEI